MLVGSIVSRRVRLPYTMILVFLGIAIASLSISSLTGIDTLYSGILGNSFVALVLPPLLFESMMNIRSSELKTAIRPAILMATVGVVLATIVGGLLLWKLAGLPVYEAFLFSSLISPTDTASVLEIFKRLRVPRKLAALMDAEAAFNDATGLIVFSIILASGSSSSLANFQFASPALNFAILLGGGVIVGLLLGFGAEIISSMISDSLSETILSISMVYGSYAISTALGFSGLVSVAVTGLYYGNLTLRTVVRPLSKEQVKTFWGVVAFMANSVAFLYIGLNTNIFKLYASMQLILVAYAAVIAARIAVVYPIMTFFGRLAERTRRWKNVAVLGGMRGAISVAIVASIPVAAISAQIRSTLLTMVLGVVFLSIVIQGPSLARYIRRAFPEEQVDQSESPEVRLSSSLGAIEELQKLWSEGKIEGGIFASRLEDERERLAELMAEINSALKTGDVVKSRARDLFSSISSISRTRPAEAMWRRRTDGQDEESQDDVQDRGG